MVDKSSSGQENPPRPKLLVLCLVFRYYDAMNTFKTRAFTLIEVLVIIVVIGIISTMSIIGYSSVQQNARDDARSSKATVISEALEKYYDKNKEYPSVASLADQPLSAVKQKLNIQDADTLVFPTGTANTSALSSSSPTTTRVTYAGSPAGASCQSDPNGYCDSFQLQYITEATGLPVTITNRQGSDYVGVVAPPSVAPSAPVVSASGTSTTSISISWGASTGTSPITYTVQYGTTTSYSSTACASTSSTSCNLTGLVPSGPGTLYYIRVVATNAAGTASGTTSAYTDPTTVGVAPSAPSVTATTQSSSSISVSWSASSGTAPISYSVSGGGNASSCSSSPCTVTGLAASTTYTFSVTASNTYGSATGSASATTSASAPSCSSGPSQPTVNASPSSSSGIQVSWTASSTPSGCAAPTYRVNYGTTTTYASTACSSISSTSCSITGLAASTLYYIKVTPSNNYGDGAAGTTTATTDPPTSLTFASADIDKTGDLNIYWTATQLTGTAGYAIDVYNPSSGGTISCGSIVNTSGNNYRCTRTGLDRCWNSRNITISKSGYSTSGSASGFTTVPNPPGSLAKSAATTNSFDISWNIGSAASYSQVRYKRADGTGSMMAGETVSSPHTLGSLASATSYVVYIYASNCYAKHYDALNGGNHSDGTVESNVNSGTYSTN